MLATLLSWPVGRGGGRGGPQRALLPSLTALDSQRGWALHPQLAITTTLSSFHPEALADLPSTWILRSLGETAVCVGSKGAGWGRGRGPQSFFTHHPRPRKIEEQQEPREGNDISNKERKSQQPDTTSKLQFSCAMFHRTLLCCKHPEVLSPKGPASEGFGKVSHLSQEDGWHSEVVAGGAGEEKMGHRQERYTRSGGNMALADLL